jgi:hypothetical protein
MCPYTQTPPTISYPAVSTNAWVVISRLAETPTRTVASLTLVNGASELGLPFPTGNFPTKTITQVEEYQSYDSLGRPLYDNGSGGTTSPTDDDGNALPPLMTSVSEQVVISIQDQPTQFSTTEVIQACINDFLTSYNGFYDWGKLVVFDDRYDTISVYENQQVASGFGSGAAPIFMGPIQGYFDPTTDPGGYILLVAPTLQGIDWLFQIRHGIAGTSGFTGPIADIPTASRQVNSGNTQEVTKLYPMQNTPIPHIGLVDATGQFVNHFWVRTYANKQADVPNPA